MSRVRKMRPKAVDLFSGAGGASLGLVRSGYDVIGFELDPVAAATHHRMSRHVSTVVGDLREIELQAYPSRVEWLHSSPPCTSLSTAGKKEGMAHRTTVADVVVDAFAGTLPDLSEVDTTTLLMLETVRWILWARPWYISMEQSPNALPVWEAYATALRMRGYSAWAGVLSAEMYGVPQVRRRAWLIASRVGEASPPTPTHSAYYPRSPGRRDDGVLPWVPMSEATGLSYLTDDVVNDQSGTPFDRTWPTKRPSTVLPAGRLFVQHPGATANRYNGATKSRNDGVALTVAQAAAIQGFPVTVEWVGNKAQVARQIGNAVPPAVMEAVVTRVRCTA